MLTTTSLGPAALLTSVPPTSFMSRCASGRTELLTAPMLATAGARPGARVLDLGWRMRVPRVHQ